jgi:type II secretory pathway component PulC
MGSNIYMKRFLRNINLLNVLLIAAILIFVNYTILPLLNMNVRFTLPTATRHPVQKEEKAAESSVPSLTDYTVIAEENLFHPGRTIPVETAEEQTVPKPEFVLLGTVITDDMKLAYLENLKEPYSTAGRGKRQRSLRIGDTLSSYTLAEVYPEKVVMVRGQDRIEVNLDDSTKQRTSGAQINKSGGIASPPPSSQQPPARHLPARVSSRPSAGSQDNTSRDNLRNFHNSNRRDRGAMTQGGMTNRESKRFESLSPPPAPTPNQ